MKSQSEVEARIRSIVNAEFESRLEASTQRLPCRCVFNHRQPLDVRRQVEGAPNSTYNRVAYAHGQTIGLCMYGAQDEQTWPGVICEDPIDAQRCEYFTPDKSREDLVTELKRDLKDPEWLKTQEGLNALLWVRESECPQLGWFQRFWFWLTSRLRGGRLKPALPPFKLEVVLEALEEKAPSK